MNVRFDKLAHDGHRTIMSYNIETKTPRKQLTKHNINEKDIILSSSIFDCDVNLPPQPSLKTPCNTSCHTTIIQFQIWPRPH